MALGDSLRGLFTNNPVNRVGPTGEPNIGGSNVTDLIGRSVGGLLGRDMRTEAAKLTEGIQGIGQDDPDRLRKMVELQLQSAVRTGDRPAAAQLANTLERIRSQEYTAAQLAKPKVALSSGIRLKDEAGNYFNKFPSAAGGPDNIITYQTVPEIPGTRPVGKLTNVDEDTGLTTKEQIELDAKSAGASKLAEKRAETFSETEASIYDAGYNAISSIGKMKQVKSFIDSDDFKSGGAQSLISKGKQFFGIETADVGMFKEATARILLEALNSFTGAISEGERNYLRENLANMEQSTEINRALIADFIKVLEKARERARVYSKGNPEINGGEWTSATWFQYLDKNEIFTNEDADKSIGNIQVKPKTNTGNGQGPLMSKQNRVVDGKLIRPPVTFF